MIDLMPPGLYEAVITEVSEDTENPELIQGRYLFRLESRTLDDIRALGANDAADDLRFATAARVSEINKGLYQTVAAPAVRAIGTQPVAEALRQTHPNRLRFAMFSDKNPLMQPVKAMAEAARTDRRPVAPDNPWLGLEKSMSAWITMGLEAYGNARDVMTEAMFLSTYGSPLLQAMVGLGSGEGRPRIERDLAREATAARHRSDLANQFEAGGAVQALLRALIYIRLPDRSADERSFAMLKAVRAAQPVDRRLPLREVKEILKTQFLLLQIDAGRAVAAIPELLARGDADRMVALEALRRVVAAAGALPEESRRRLAEIEALFDVQAPEPRQIAAKNGARAKGKTLHA